MYLELFVDSFTSALFFMLNSEFMLTAMVNFEGYNHNTIFIISSLGWICGLMTNWLIGYTLINTARKYAGFSIAVEKNYDKMRNFFNRNLFWIVAFSGFNPNIMVADLYTNNFVKALVASSGTFMYAIYSTIPCFAAGIFKSNPLILFIIVSASRVLYIYKFFI